MIKPYLSIFFLAILLFAMAFMTSSVKAERYAMEWGHLAKNDEGQYNWNEGNMSLDVCTDINALFNIRNMWYGGTVPSCNAYWTYTSGIDLYSCLGYQATQCDFVTNFWVGDFHWQTLTPPYGHIYFYGEETDPPLDITDNGIYLNAVTYPGYSKQYFDFIWTCSSAGLYWNNFGSGTYYSIDGIYPQPIWSINTPTTPPVNINTEYAYYNGGDSVGMPYAWTGHSDMNLNGYSNPDYESPYCYIGFECSSPFMLDSLPGTGGWWQAHYFPEAFYHAALGWWDDGYYQSVHNSLDEICVYFYSEPFDYTTLANGWWHWRSIDGYEPNLAWYYCCMRVFGDSAIFVDPEPPVP
jgi:hypothetical protein